MATNQEIAAGICDRHGTWGHVQWEKECKAVGLKPIFGVELAVVENMHEREKQAVNYMSFIAKNNAGLSELYELVTTATEYFYYIPRIDYNLIDEISENIFVLSGNNPNLKRFTPTKDRFVELSPSSNLKIIEQAARDRHCFVATSDNYFCTPDDKPVYEIAMSGPKMSADLHTHDMHIVTEHDLKVIWGDQIEEAMMNNHVIEHCCDVQLPKAKMVKPVVEDTLEEMCIEGAAARKIDINRRTL